MGSRYFQLQWCIFIKTIQSILDLMIFHHLTATLLSMGLIHSCGDKISKQFSDLIFTGSLA